MNLLPLDGETIEKMDDIHSGTLSDRFTVGQNEFESSIITVDRPPPLVTYASFNSRL
ncbi:MAG: hypothetical protein ACRD8Z_12285 [Nitrososphaeraceae archaeon]